MRLEELEQWLAERNLKGHWQSEARQPEFKPYLWKWADIYQGLMQATELVSMERTERRTIQLRNPSLKDRMTHTIHISVQCVMPGEIARAHRHTGAAIRFILKGFPGACTVIEGEPAPMEPGDLITTPSWTWHDHCNTSNEPAIWLDSLDSRLLGMTKTFRENFPNNQQPQERPAGYSAHAFGYAKPSWIKSQHLTPPFRYRWEDTYATLLALKNSDGDPYNGIHLTYTHPEHGGPTLPTFSCEVQLLRQNEKTKSHRHNSTAVYHAFRGAGVTVVDGERLAWTQGDIFVVPPWARHSHENRLDQDAILFSVNDWPTMVALGIYREEPE